MNESSQNKLRRNSSKEANKANTEASSNLEHGTPATRSTYESFSWFLCYIKMFIFRLARDLIQSAMSYFRSGETPDHIVELMRVQEQLQQERDLHSVTLSSCRKCGLSLFQSNLNQCHKIFKCYILSSEDEMAFQITSTRNKSTDKKQEMLVIVDSRGISNPGSQELLIDNNPTDDIFRKYLAMNIESTSKDTKHPSLMESESQDELQMMDINLQSENEIFCDNDSDSIVIAYIKNRDAILEMEGTILANKKKTSLLENVPKMETILEGEQFSAFKITPSSTKLASNETLTSELSDNSLDAYITSYPGTPRSFLHGSGSSSVSLDIDSNLEKALKLIHADYELLMAAEVGNDELVDKILRKGANIHQVDHVGRNALHLAVCSGNVRAIQLLLQAGVNPNVKDNVGMTPLSICLMRRPSFKVATLLFEYDAKVISRSNPMDTGLFIQFVMMCIPTNEEKEILKLLAVEGGLVDDPDAPGGRQALHFAAMSNNCDLIRILVDLGADLYAVNHRYETPKEVAATFKCREAEALLQELEDRDTEERERERELKNNRYQ